MLTKTIMLFVVIFLSLLLGITGCTLNPGPPTVDPNLPTPTPTQTATSSLPSATPSATSSPTVTPTPTPTNTPLPGVFTESQLKSVELPPRDLANLAHKFQRENDEPRDIRNNFVVDDTDEFWILDNSVEPPKILQITARLAHVTDHSYWWVEDGRNLPQTDIVNSAEAFEQNIYPTTRALFGSEATPGIDQDERIHILMGRIPGVAGYFSAANQYTQRAVPYSNQREMFFINLDAIRPGQAQFDSVLAHEFQHMIHWQQDSNEDTWLNEGLSELAKFINGYGQSNFTGLYIQQPNLQLTSWGRNPGTRQANYGASFLFTLYLYDQFGPEFIRDLIIHPSNGALSVEETLQAQGINRTFDQVFADFIIANYLNMPELDNGQWGYNVPELKNASTPKHHQTLTEFPVVITDTVKQYGVKYIELQHTTPLTLSFYGATTVTVLNNKPHSGRYQWYSQRSDNLDTTLTREFDLSGLSTATLQFWAWYDIEKDWDYAYVTVSSNKGETWDILSATTSNNTNPVGNAYGPGFTGNSQGWVEETVDLTPYAGQKVLIRFEYITDDAVSLPGLALDDIHIPELDYQDDVEKGDGDWIGHGFVRIDNILPQSFIVRIIQYSTDNTPQINQISLDEENDGIYFLTNLDQKPLKTILVISAQSLVTTQEATFNYTIK